MMLSPHFSLNELTATQVRLPNAPGPAEVANLTRLCNDVLEPIRTLLGVPLTVSSGYRSPEVNARVGGSQLPLSAHCAGRAADFVLNAISLTRAMDLIASTPAVPFDKLIFEAVAGRSWLHVQVPEEGTPPRRLVLMTFDAKYYQSWNSADPRVAPEAVSVEDPDSGSSVRA